GGPKQAPVKANSAAPAIFCLGDAPRAACDWEWRPGANGGQGTPALNPRAAGSVLHHHVIRARSRQVPKTQDQNRRMVFKGLPTFSDAIAAVRREIPSSRCVAVWLCAPLEGDHPVSHP